MRGITHKCNLESVVWLQEESNATGTSYPRGRLHYTTQMLLIPVEFCSGVVHLLRWMCVQGAAQDLLLYWTTTEGQRVRSGASSEGQRGSGHHLKDKETRKTIWRHRVGPSAVFSYKSRIGSEHSQSVRERHLGDVVAILFLWPAEGLPSGADSQLLQARRHFRLTPVSWDADIMHKK